MNALDTAVKAPSKKSPRTPLSPMKGNNIIEDPKIERPSGDELSISDDLEMEDMSDDGLQDDEETGLTGKDKNRRRRRRRRNTLLDQRISGEIQITAEEKRLADQNVIKKGLINGLLILLWYIFSLSISIVCSLLKLSRNTANYPSVQQMDVRPQTPRFSLSPLHNMLPYAGTILAGITCTILHPKLTTSIRLHIQSK